MSCGCFGGSVVHRKRSTAQATDGIDEQLLRTVNHLSYSQLRSATDDFHSRNRIGVGGFGTVYKLRGIAPVSQPLVDSSGNILAYNGEIFGGIEVGSDNNDTEILMQSLGKCCSCCSEEHTTICSFKGQRKGSVPDVLSVMKGPWAIIYWQESSKTLWFGRDAFGRRSLLVHWPTMEDPRFLLSSVSPTSSSLQDFEVENGISSIKFWEELPCGIYSMSVDATKSDGIFLGEIKKHEWTNVMLKELIEWERVSVEPKLEELYFSRSKTLSAECDTNSASSDATSEDGLIWDTQMFILLRYSCVALFVNKIVSSGFLSRL